MPSYPRARRYASKQLSERMKEAGEQLALDFRKATAFEHAGIQGGQREESVRRFLQERLPGGYEVTTGTVFDARDKQSKQLDVLIYRVRDTPFLVPGDPVLVPCESLLAAIEIKSTLTAAKLREGLEVARSIRGLRLVLGRSTRNSPMSGRAARRQMTSPGACSPSSRSAPISPRGRTGCREKGRGSSGSRRNSMSRRST